MAASQPLSLSGAGAALGQLVLAGGGFMPARLLLAPVGARLPPGVHAVAAVPATAVVAAGGSGSRRAIRLLPPAAAPATVGARLPPVVQAVAVVAAPVGGRATTIYLPRAAVPDSGEPAPEADDGGASFKGGAYVFDNFIATEGLDGLLVLNDIVPSTDKPELASKIIEVKTELEQAVRLAAGHTDDKMNCALGIMNGWYGMVELAHAAYPSAGLPPLPGRQAFLSKCLGLGVDDRSPAPVVILGQDVAPLLVALEGSNLLSPDMPDADAELIRSVFVAVAVSQAALRTVRA